MSIYIPENASVPPVVGEYGYYDARINPRESKINLNISHWIIRTRNKQGLGCYYSLKSDMGRQSFVTCHGIITEVVKQTVKGNKI